MTHNIFQELQDKKQTLINIANKAVEFGWIPQNKSHDNEKFKDLISLEDMFEKDVWKVGYFNYRGCDMSNDVNVEIIANFQEDGTGTLLEGDLFTMMNTRPFSAYDSRESGILTVNMDALRQAIAG